MMIRFLGEKLNGALTDIFPEVGEIFFNISADNRFGDYTTNIALVAKEAGKNPREIAETIVGKLKENREFCAVVADMNVAGPGFINFTLTPETVLNELLKITETAEKGFDFIKGKKINIEFISANPTGALHLGHGRGAFYGDTLANVFSLAGADVVREYYVNDSRESNQIKELGKLTLKTGEQYKTEKTGVLIEKNDFSGMSEVDAGFKLATLIQRDNRDFIEGKLGIRFDEWYSEDGKLRTSGTNQKMFEEMKEKGFIYEKDGAWWAKTTEYGDDEDRVVLRSDGTFSYFLSDISYHADKFSRRYKEVIDVWGADHHGHVKRMTAVKKMLGWEGDFRVFITQLVSLKENGESAKMSKRAGNIVLLEDLVREISLDVVRWFYNERALNTHMEFDVALAKERSEKNPVFYVQYAHARMASIIANCAAFGGNGTPLSKVLQNKSARALAMKLVQFSEIIKTTADDCQVNRLTTYAYELASHFSQFYRDVRVIEEEKYNDGALELVQSGRIILAKTLSLLGVSAPEKM
jgi:arginyl-tRNA synthetase